MSIPSIDQAFSRATEFPTTEAQAVPNPGRDEAAALSELTDGASLSSLAPRLKVVLDEIAGPNDNVVSALSDNVSRLQDGFIDRLYSVLSGQGVDLSSKLTLRLDEKDMLAVSGNHPEKATVEAALADHPELSVAFGEIASQSELLRDMRNISKVMISKGGVENYARMAGDGKGAMYQMSLKGEMSHFYFSGPS